MALRSFRWVPLVLVLPGFAVAGITAQKGPALADVLQSAADYLVQYSERLAVISAEESYTQYETSSGKMSTPRRLTADYVLVGLGGGGLAGFRDVFGIDNKALRPREERLVGILQKRSTATLDQARQLSEESVRQYISGNLHALDQPTTALEFLRKENQDRSTFKLEGVKTTNGSAVATLRFTEKNGQRLIPSAEDAGALGRFWIDVATGAVRQTELSMNSKTMNVRTSVKYVDEPTLRLWLPLEMSQVFDLSGNGSGSVSNMGSGGGYSAHQTLEARMSYSKFKQVPTEAGKE
jgi:hypothetical protein